MNSNATDDTYNQLRLDELNARLIVEMNFPHLYPQKVDPDA